MNLSWRIEKLGGFVHVHSFFARKSCKHGHSHADSGLEGSGKETARILYVDTFGHLVEQSLAT